MQHCRQTKLTAAILMFFVSPLVTAGASCNTVTWEQSSGTYIHQHTHKKSRETENKHGFSHRTGYPDDIF